MNRRDFLKRAGAFGAGVCIPPSVAPSAVARLSDGPSFRTRHLVTIVLGNGARRMDVVEDFARCPFQTRMAAEGTLFVRDENETVSLHGHMVSELLSGRAAPSQRPLFPTWNEYVRKKTGGRASDFWMLQGASYYRAWAWDVKNFSRHPDYGVRYGATNLTMTKLVPSGARGRLSPRELFERDVEPGLGYAVSERRQIEDWLDDVVSSRAYEPPVTARPLVERPFAIGDYRSIVLAGKLLRDLAPKMITVQVLALDEAHAEPGVPMAETGIETYHQHLGAIDELLGALWAGIQADPGLKDTTALLIRPDCGRDGTVDSFGQLGHTPGDPHAHVVWTSALGPDFARGRVVREAVDRRDLAPTITYLMGGGTAEHATGRVRSALFGGRDSEPEAERSTEWK